MKYLLLATLGCSGDSDPAMRPLFVPLVSLSSLLLVLTGCGVDVSSATSAAINVAYQGSVHGYLNVFNAAGAILSGTTGYQTGSTAADSIAIDGSGNVWFTPVNSTTVAGDTTIYEMVGAATPTVTPIAAAVANNTLGSRP